MLALVATLAVANAVSEEWNAIAISDNGKYQTATLYSDDDSKMMYRSEDNGESWSTVPNTQFTPSVVTGSYFESIAMSGDGKYQLAGELYLYESTDHGKAWARISIPEAGGFTDVAVNTDNTRRTVIGDTGSSRGIYTWSATTQSWTKSTTPANRVWRSLAMSGDGKYQAVLDRDSGVSDGKGHIYQSFDYGATWTKITSGVVSTKLQWTSIAMSDNGQDQTAVVFGGTIYQSNDRGATWAKATSNGDFDNSVPHGFVFVAMNGDGARQIAYSGSVFQMELGLWDITADTTLSSASGVGVAAAISKTTGQYQTILFSNGFIHRSADFGISWSTNTDIIAPPSPSPPPPPLGGGGGGSSSSSSGSSDSTAWIIAGVVVVVVLVGGGFALHKRKGMNMKDGFTSLI